MKRILSLCLCLVMVLGLFAGCGKDPQDTTPETQPHKHTYSKTWSMDDSQHWYAADCGHDLKANAGAHVDSDVDGVCDICAWEDTSCQHTFDEEKWMTDETNHWHAATCTHFGAVKDLGAHIDENNDGACDVCAFTGEHKHTYENVWSSDATSHWYAASCGHDLKTAESAHGDYNVDGVCDVCGWFDANHSHTFAESWSSDVIFHWYAATCEHTGAAKEKAQHADANGDLLCDTCAFEMCNHEDYDEDGSCDKCGWYDPDHTHTYGELVCDKNHHWRVATCHKGAISEKLAHVDANKDGVCDDCAFQICGHSYAAEWTYDDTHHWHAILCTCNIPRKDYEPHELDAKGVCYECMYGYVAQSGYEVLAKDEPLTLQLTGMLSWVEFKVNFPQAGRYVITISNPDGTEDIRMTEEKGAEVNRQNDGFTVEVEEAGEKTLWVRVFDMSTPNGTTRELEVTYSLVRSDDLVVDTLKGKVELPTNTLYKLKFTAPEVGEYKMITSVTGLVIGLTEDSMEYFKGHISFTVTEVGQEFTFYIVLNDSGRQSFLFDWILEPPFSLNIDAEGNFAVAVSPNQIDYKVVFTAPVAGYYAFSVDTAWLTFCYWSETHNQPVRGDGDLLEKQQILTGWLEAGEVFTTWLQTVYNYPDSVDCRDTLTITNIGQMVELGESDLTVDNSGSKYTFTANETTYYCLAAENGEIGIIGANGNVTWLSYYEVKVQAGYSYTFMVRGEGDVKLHIDKTYYNTTVDAGLNTILLKPAKEYDVTFGTYYLLNADGSVSDKQAEIDDNCFVKLNWTNTRLQVFVNGAQIQPGTVIEVMHSVVTIKLLSNAEAEVELAVEVTNPKSVDDAPEGEKEAILQSNQQATLLIQGGMSPATAEFTAEYGGTYTFTCKSDVQVDVYVRAANGEDHLIFSGTDGSYNIQLEAGQTITFVVKCALESDVNAFVMIAPKQ